MDKALLDYEVSIDTDCKMLTVGKPFAIEGEYFTPPARLLSSLYMSHPDVYLLSSCYLTRVSFRK